MTLGKQRSPWPRNSHCWLLELAKANSEGQVDEGGHGFEGQVWYKMASDQFGQSFVCRKSLWQLPIPEELEPLAHGPYEEVYA